MKKLLPIYGHIFPLHLIPFNGTNQNAFSKSITLTPNFQDSDFSHTVNNSRINSTLPFTFPVRTGNAPNDIFFVQSIPYQGVNDFSFMPEKYSIRFSTNNSTLSKISRFKNKHQHTF